MSNSHKSNDVKKNINYQWVTYKKSSSMLNVKDIIESNPYTNVWELVEYIEELNLIRP